MTTPTVASAPFNKKTADVILRSSNNVDFHVLKGILAEASPFFEDMFSFARPSAVSSSPGDGDDNLDVDVIPVEEDSKTIDSLLRLCYPVTDPNFTDLSPLENVLEAAIKYQLGEAIALTRRSLQTFIEAKPLHVFAIACRLKLEEEARMAAQAWKAQHRTSHSVANFLQTLAGASYIPEMRRISSACYLRLLHFVRTDSPAIRFTERSSPFSVSNSPSTSDAQKKVSTSSKDDLHAFANLGDTDVIVRSYDGAEFHVHKIALRFVRGQKLLDCPHTTYTDKDKGELPVYNIEASGDVLAELLRLCYPAAGMVLEDFTLLRKIVEVAIKYDMTMIVQMVKKQLMKIADDHPLDLYFLAVQCGWDDVAQEAAKAASKLMLEEQYVSEMENTSAEAYHHLFEYQYGYTTAVSEVITRHAVGATRWKKVGVKAGTNSSNAIPPTLSFALMETELVKAGNAGICPNANDHYRNSYSYSYGNNAVSAAYALQPEDLLTRSKSLEKEMEEAQSKACDPNSTSIDEG